MDRFDVIKFEDLTGPRGGEWVKIGGGSFGVVFRGEYLGTEVAIKEVLPNNTYDVEKYFERECVLMKEARHPNIVQYIGLTKSPGPKSRIYIISEFVGGNLRSYIADKRKAFDWPLRVSFATDIARAVAYLHARNCLHRDLKGENLLITANDRIKVCDFGFARIAARNEEEMRRISYCGTDGYMSPEILMGVDFSLPSDIFSLGIIFCEIISRHLVDANTFKRQMPSFGLDEDEVREMASKGCPPDLIELSIDCCKVEPSQRPDMRQVIKRLRIIEQQVMQQELQKGKMDNVGSLRGSSLQAVMGEKMRKKAARPIVMRLPSFSGQIKIENDIKEETTHEQIASEESSSDDDVEEALQALENVNIGIGMPGTPMRGSSKMAIDSIGRASSFKVSGHGNPWWDEDSDGTIAVPSSWVKSNAESNDMSLDGSSPEISPILKKEGEEEYSTSVIRPSKVTASRTDLATALDGMNDKVNAMETDQIQGSNVTVRRRAPLSSIGNTASVHQSQLNGVLSEAIKIEPFKPISHIRADSGEGFTQSFMTARSSHHHAHEHLNPSLAMATLASSIYEPTLLYHRFTLIKNGMKRPTSIQQTIDDSTTSTWGGSLIPAQLILANALTKCNVCNKRLGFGAYMDCDDCPYKTHVGCAAMAEPTCQEMQIPYSGGNTPILTPLNASRRGSGNDSSASGSPPSAAALALAKAFQSQFQPSSSSTTTTTTTTTNSRKEKEFTKSPPNTVSRGVHLFGKRKNSKTSPPKVNPAIKA